MRESIVVLKCNALPLIVTQADVDDCQNAGRFYVDRRPLILQVVDIRLFLQHLGGCEVGSFNLLLNMDSLEMRPVAQPQGGGGHIAKYQGYGGAYPYAIQPRVSYTTHDIVLYILVQLTWVSSV
jgi:hypothetical protein